MLERFVTFMGSDQFMPHGHCYLWLPEILWLHVVSDALIVISYYSIPLAILYFARKRAEAIPFPELFYLFGAFIVLCGTIHIMEMLVIWHPYYGLEGLVKGLTAIVSVATAYWVWKLMPDALMLKTPGELNRINQELQNAYTEVEHKIVERNRELAALVKEYEVTMNTVLDGLIVIDDKGAIQSANPATFRAFGYTREELLGQNVKMLMPEPYQSEHDGYLRNYLQTGEAKVIGIGREVSARRKDGSVFPIELGINEMQIDDKRMFVGTIHDITERKQYEARLIESENFQKMIKESNPDLIFVKDREFRIVDANAALLNLYPEPMRSQVIGYTTVERYSKEEADRFLEMDARAFTEGYADSTETIRFPDGRTRTLYTQKIRFENAKGEPFILGISRDVTEREGLIEKLVASNAELERFAYVASHDMQEPLRMIVNFSEIIAKEYHESLDEQGMEYLRLVVDSGIRMRDMVDDLLEYSRLGNEAMRIEHFNVSDILAAVLSNLRGLIDERCAEITHDPLPQIQGNPVQLMRLLQNLIANAIKYQPPGNIPRIRISISDAGACWQVSVKDNGVGIRQDFVKQIFQPFRRLHSYTEIKGTGLGLAICKRIVENHGGTIWVESMPNQGSEFFFTLLKTLPQPVKEAA